MTEGRDFDTLTPEVRLRVNEEELPLDVQADLVSVSVLEDVNAMDMFTFTLLCWDGQEMRVTWIDDDRFKEGNSVEIHMGYLDNIDALFRGEITGLEPEFPKDLPPTLTVRGYDRSHRLMGKRKTRTFLNMTDSDIANQIAGEWSLRPEAEDTRVTLDYVLQHNRTDFEFLRERAQRIGYEFLVTDTTLKFRPRQNEGSAEITLRREVELLDFSARLTTIGQLEEVFVRGWSPKDKEELVAHSAMGDEKAMGGTASGPARVHEVFGDTADTMVDTPVLNQAEADQLADGWFAEMALHYVEGHGVCIGRPDLRAGTLVEIEGLGRRFSGSYYITSTEHSFTPSTGYQTAFTVMRNST